VAGWAAVIFAVSSLSLGGGGLAIPDWLTHGGAYALLSVLTCRALAGGFALPLSWRAGMLSVLLSTAYGVSDEWHQSFVPQRDSSAADVAKDFGGAALAALVYWRLAARQFSERSLASEQRGGVHPHRGA
jgi:VanZ family protein